MMPTPISGRCPRVELTTAKHPNKRHGANEQAAWRELKEETGVCSARIVAKIDDWLYYDLPEEVVGFALKGKYRGQKQKWFAMTLTGPESEINIAADDGLEQEFDQWKWSDMGQLVNLIVPFKRDVYAAVIKQFAHLSP